MSVQDRNDQAVNLLRADMAYPGEIHIGHRDAEAGAVASFDFQNIPATFRALRLILSMRSTKAAVTTDPVIGTFNGDGSANYYLEDLYATAVTPASFEVRGSTSLQIASGTAAAAPAGAFCTAEILIADYANANKIPSFISSCFTLRGTTTGLQVVELKGGALNVVGALNRIMLSFAADNIAQYSSAELLGIGGRS